ncbi:acyltransferase family protein [Tundrisphaera lichenicola]|uniref:acyltransferase family protein n=1 Tax=Tundrisphaera lichenicola TaxID=2029860 RepID=UPI003EC00B40
MPRPPGHDPRYESLDAWRGLACLMVVLHHSGFALTWAEVGGTSGGDWARFLPVWFVRQMDLGVPLFFVISGYCIAASLDAHRRRGASSWSFLRRRLRRIYPPYWVALLAFVMTTWGLDRAGLHHLHDGGHSLELTSPGELNRAQWLGNITLTETWRSRAWGGGAMEVFTRVAWSLCYEEQFYLLSFLILLAAPRRLFPALGIATAGIVGFRGFASDVGWLFSYEGSFIYLWHEFAVGLAVYWRLVHAESPRSKRLIDASLVGLMVMGLLTTMRSTWVASLFGLGLIALRDFDGPARRSGWLRACGRRCYSIYLIHLLVCTVGNEWLYGMGLVGFWARVLVMIPIVSTAAVGTGWLFFEAIERHFLNRPADHRPHPRPVAGEVPTMRGTFPRPPSEDASRDL